VIGGAGGGGHAHEDLSSDESRSDVVVEIAMAEL
jgi:hypothetical protein